MGLHELGREPLKLKPYYEDNLLGTRPLGSLSLTLALAYFVGLGLGIFSVSFALTLSQQRTLILGILFSFLFLGVALFVLPLRSVHRRMIQVKRREQLLLRNQFSETFRAFTNPGPEDMRQILIRMANMHAFEATEKKVASIATWPFDTAILGRLTAIILAVMATIIARFIIVALHL